MCKKLFVLMLVLAVASVGSAVNWSVTNVELKDGAIHDVSTTESVTGWMKISCRPSSLATTLNVNSGADVSIGNYIWLGHYSDYYNSGSFATLNVNGGEISSAGFKVGSYHGKGVLNVSSGTLESSSYMAIGAANNSGSLGDGPSIADITVSGGLVKGVDIGIGQGGSYPYNVTNFQLTGGVLEGASIFVGQGGTDTTLNIAGGTIILTGQTDDPVDIGVLLDATATSATQILAYGNVDGAGGGKYGFNVVWDDMEETVTITAVPEPATIALLGLGGLALIRRKR